MLYQPHLFDRTIVVEREMAGGSVIKLMIRPIDDNKVEILEYFKKKHGLDKFKRIRAEEGKTVEFRKLGLKQSFDYLFAEKND